MIWILITIAILFLGIRLIFFIRFLKSISKVCHIYDWKLVDENPEEYLVEILKDGYYLKCDWSAYNFMFLKGPSPFRIFFSFYPLKLEYFYKIETINKIKNKVI
jgi:hypothetical protein